MYNSYKGGKYSNYNSGRYKPSSYSRKKRNMIRLRNRFIIVTCGVVAVTLIITLFSLFLKNCVCVGCAGKTPTTQETATVDTTHTEPATQETEKKSKKKKEQSSQQLSFVAPDIKDDGKSKGKVEYGLYIWQNTVFRAFKGNESNAQSYADVINNAKKALGDDVNVYSMLVPTHIEMGLPQRLKNTEKGIATNPQSDYIKSAYSKLDKNVTSINCYNELSKHCNEFIYFNTDYRWTALGAYYGYNVFARTSGIEPISLESLDKNKLSGFVGSYEAYYSDLDLGKETIEYWSSDDIYDVSVDITTEGGDVVDAYSCFYTGPGIEADKSIVFLQGDYPMEVITSSSKNAKEDKICVVHESFGNPIISYFTNNYKEVYSVNMNLFDGSLKNLCKKNDIKKVLFLNDVASSADAETLKDLKEIIG